MSKSTHAFRTIREVADWLDVAAHVLRFWESKFPQIKPVKRAGGRRYYRPADMELVGGIKVLLHDEGMTIRGVQKKIRTDGVAAIAALSPPLDGLLVQDEAVDAETAEWEADAAAETASQPAPQPQFETEGEPETQTGQFRQAALPFDEALPADTPAEASTSMVASTDASEDPAPGSADARDAAPASRADTIAGLARLVREGGPLEGAARDRAAPALAALRALSDRMRADLRT